MRRLVQAFASSSALPENWPAEAREAIAAFPDHYNLGEGDEARVVRSLPAPCRPSACGGGSSLAGQRPQRRLTCQLDARLRSVKRNFGRSLDVELAPSTQRCSRPLVCLKSVLTPALLDAFTN